MMHNTQVILVDVLGCIISPKMINQQLMPFFWDQLENWPQHESAMEIRHELDKIERDLEEDGHYIKDLSTSYLEDFYAPKDVHRNLGELQAIIWSTGVRNQRIDIEVYDDVVNALNEWKSAGFKVALLAPWPKHFQTFLLSNHQHEDLQHIFDYFFDATTGNHHNAQTYQTVLEELKIDATALLLLSADEAALNAAREKQVATAKIVRPTEGFPASKHATLGKLADVLGWLQQK